MDEDDIATDMGEEYEDNKDEDDEEEAVAVAEEVEPEGWVKHMKAGSIVWEAFL